jgi:hypothetical protein
MAVRDELEKVTESDFNSAIQRQLQESMTASEDEAVWGDHMRTLADRYAPYKAILKGLLDEVRANPEHGDHRCVICYLEGQRAAIEALTLL